MENKFYQLILAFIFDMSKHLVCLFRKFPKDYFIITQSHMPLV